MKEQKGFNKWYRNNKDSEEYASSYAEFTMSIGINEKKPTFKQYMRDFFNERQPIKCEYCDGGQYIGPMSDDPQDCYKCQDGYVLNEMD